VTASAAARSGVAAGLYHQDTGAAGAAGPPLVLVHGAGGRLRQWPAALRELPGRRVIALDLPGHGSSPPPAHRSVPAYARSVLGLLDSLGVGTAAIAGHSMGGAVALALALEAPSRVAALALVGTGARLRVAAAILQATADPERFRVFAERSADLSFGPGASAALRREFADDWRAAGAEVAHGDFLACDAFDAMSRLGEIRAPTLVICGAEDRLTPLRYSEYLRDHVAGARLEVLAGAGHMVMLEAPAAVADAVGGFLAGL